MMQTTCGRFFLRTGLSGLFVVLVGIGVAAAADILVYDENTRHNLAATAAANIDPTAVVGNHLTFNTLLQSQEWDAVLIDCPSTIPLEGWQPTIDYINNGGRVAMSFWEWANEFGFGSPGLLPAFGIESSTGLFSSDGRTLIDSGETNVFDGVTMPNTNWHDHWGIDGHGLAFSPASGSIGMAYLSGIDDPVMVQGNGGRTIAAFLIDDIGNTWLSNGSGVRLWENMYRSLVPEPGSLSLLAIASLVLLRRPSRR
jgi:hypothetical protein